MSKPNYSVGHDRLTVQTPNVKVEISCPGGLSLETAKELIDRAEAIEFTARRNLESSRMFHNTGVRSTYDSKLPNGVVEFRDENGTVLYRVEGVGLAKSRKLPSKPVKLGTDDEDDEDPED